MIITESNVVQGKQHMPMLVAEREIEYTEYISFKNPENIVKILNDVFNLKAMAEEYMYMLTLTSACELISVFELSHGTYNMSLVGGREIMIRALLSGAAGIILVHNHPSGSIVPSKEDINETERINEICILMGIDFLDHIIIGGDDFYSFEKAKYN